MAMNKNNVGHRIRQLRNENNLTQEECANFLGISVTYMGMLEQGIRTASLDVYIAIADYFHVTLDYLLLGKSQEPQQTEIKQSIQLAIIQLEKIERLL